jgi:hypothetical protein
VLETSDGAALRAIAVCPGRDPRRPRQCRAGRVRAAQPRAGGRASGEAQVSPDGFLRAVPSFAGSDTAAAVGAVAIAWTPPQPCGAVPTDHQPGAFRRRAVRLLYGAGRLLRMLVSRPVAVLAEEIVTLSAAATTPRCPSPTAATRSGRSRATSPTCRRSLPRPPRGGGARAHRRGAETVVERLAVPCNRRRWRSHAKDRHTVRAPIRTLAQILQRNRRDLRSRDRADGAQRRHDPVQRRKHRAKLRRSVGPDREPGRFAGGNRGGLEHDHLQCRNAALSAQDVERIVVDARKRAMESAKS